MQIPIYQIDAFTDTLFSGNPAAVCVLPQWLPDHQMQSIALENNLSETAFLAPPEDEKADYAIRWFTPAVEVNLCGHATLASGHVVIRLLHQNINTISFSSHSGLLTVRAQGDRLQLDFPAVEVISCEPPEGLLSSLGLDHSSARVWRANEDLLVRIEEESTLVNLQPDFAALKGVAARGIIVTAAGSESDFVSRFFAPFSGVDEDPVTGSAHCALTPYWAQELGRNSLTARQLSRRGGDLQCEFSEGRVLLAGHTRHYLSGFLHLD